jgi:hypothetical protein
MKLNKILIIICAIGVAANTVSSQQIHEITLMVDTSSIQRDDPSASCYFVAGAGTEVLVSNPPEEFTFAVEVGDVIQWRGLSSTEPDVTVEIRKIKYDQGVNLFSSDEMEGDDVVEATVTHGRTGNDYKYVISFKKGGTGTMYRIDPKIQVR